MTRRLLKSSGVRFVVLSGLSLAVNIALTSFLHRLLGWSAGVSFAVALVVGLAINFVGMRQFVHPGQTQPIRRQLPAFLLSSLGFRVIEYAAFLLLQPISPLPTEAVATLVLAASFAVKHLFYRSIVFKVRSEPPPSPAGASDRSRSLVQ